jgi:phosphoribosylcarboxyaminoimidazole (NCAIR) mutase
MRTLLGRRVFTSALLSGLLNALLSAASISSPNEERETFIQELVRIVGLPAGILVHAVGAEGHEAVQAGLLMAFSFAFYWIVI